MIPPNNNGGMTYQTDGKLLSKMIGYWGGGGVTLHLIV